MKYKRTLSILLALGVAVGLYFSHDYAYHSGMHSADRSNSTTITRVNEDGDAVHLNFGLLALQVYARHPDTGSKTERDVMCASTKIWADGVEQNVIPRLQKEGKTSEVDRLTGKVREARTLIAKVSDKPAAG